VRPGGRARQLARSCPRAALARDFELFGVAGDGFFDEGVGLLGRLDFLDLHLFPFQFFVIEEKTADLD